MTSVLMLDADLQQRIIRFIASKTGRDPGTIAPNSRLLHDLGIDGDDAEELLTEYSEVFEVDLAGFDFRHHFRSEPNLLVLWSANVSRLEPITVADLAAAARRHRWTP